MKKIIVSVMMGAALLAFMMEVMGCAYSGTFAVIGNVHDLQGNLLIGYQAELCYVLQFGKDTVSECAPVSTDQNGQFSTQIFSQGDHADSFSGFQLTLVAPDGNVYGGEVVSNDMHDDGGGTGNLVGTIVANFAVPAPSAQ